MAVLRETGDDKIIKRMHRSNSKIIASVMLFLCNHFRNHNSIKLEDIPKNFQEKVSKNTVYRIINFLHENKIIDKVWGYGTLIIPVRDDTGELKIKKYEKCALETLGVKESEYFLNKKLIDFREKT